MKSATEEAMPLRERLRLLAASVPPEVALAMCYPNGLPPVAMMGDYSDLRPILPGEFRYYANPGRER